MGILSGLELRALLKLDEYALGQFSAGPGGWQ